MVDEGWDSVAVIVDREWVLRVARPTRFASSFAHEATLTRELAPLLPLPIPVIVRHTDDWALTPFIPGKAFHGRRGGTQLAEFARALHAVPPGRFELDEHDRGSHRKRFMPYVQRELEGAERAAAEALLQEYAAADYPLVVAHTDLTAAHVLKRRGVLTGVIDWADARLADPAIDLAWPLCGAPRRFADEFARAYRVDAALRRRAEVIHAIEPWHEVEHADEPLAFARAIGRVRKRLRAATGSADTMGP